MNGFCNGLDNGDPQAMAVADRLGTTQELEVKTTVYTCIHKEANSDCRPLTRMTGEPKASTLMHNNIVDNLGQFH